MPSRPGLREEAVRRVLKDMIARAGDAWPATGSPEQMALSDPMRTTIAEMVQARLLTWSGRSDAPNWYWLTPDGWLEGLKLQGRGRDSDEFRDRHHKLRRAAKRHVDGRTKDAMVDVNDLARDAGIPVGWLTGVLESRLFEGEDDGRTSFRWLCPHVVVPRTYGLPPLRL